MPLVRPWIALARERRAVRFEEIAEAVNGIPEDSVFWNSARVRNTIRVTDACK